jgi:hypothetical protein
MGVKGPVPKRSEQRRRTNEPVIPIAKADGAGRVTVPAADRSWHPVALRWYRSLAKSGQARWYEPSDWAVAYLVAESMSRDLLEQVVGVIQQGPQAGEIVRERIPLKGASLSAYLRAFSVLLVTEGDRRRVQVELQRPEADPDDARVDATVTDLRSRLAGGPA